MEASAGLEELATVDGDTAWRFGGDAAEMAEGHCTFQPAPRARRIARVWLRRQRRHVVLAHARRSGCMADHLPRRKAVRGVRLIRDAFDGVSRVIDGAADRAG